LRLLVECLGAKGDWQKQLPFKCAALRVLAVAPDAALLFHITLKFNLAQGERALEVPKYGSTHFLSFAQQLHQNPRFDREGLKAE
jgi:hypothetical protein